MTARKNQAQPIILKAVLFIGPFRRTPLRFEISHELALRRIKSCPSAQSINGFESGRRNQPWPRVAGYSALRPQAQRRRKGFVHRLLGKIKITQQADQSRQDSSRIHTIKRVEQFAYLLGGTLGHDDDLSKPATPNQFGGSQALSLRSTSSRCCLLPLLLPSPLRGLPDGGQPDEGSAVSRSSQASGRCCWFESFLPSMIEAQVDKSHHQSLAEQTDILGWPSVLSRATRPGKRGGADFSSAMDDPAARGYIFLNVRIHRGRGKTRTSGFWQPLRSTAQTCRRRPPGPATRSSDSSKVFRMFAAGFDR